MAVQKVFLLNQNTPTVITGGFVPKGAYAAGTDYAVGDSVSYNGSSYVMYVDAAAGTLPTDTTKWQVVANIGATGATGPVDTANSPNANEFARFTDATHIEGRTAAEVKSDLDLEIGTDLQAWSSNLDEYSAVNPTAAGLALLDDATAAAQLVTLGITASAAELSYTDGVTSAIQNQIDSKQATLVSGTNIKTINSQSLLGSGDLAFTATAGGSDTQVQFNDAGDFGGDPGLTYNKTTNTLSPGNVTLPTDGRISLNTDLPTSTAVGLIQLKFNDNEAKAILAYVDENDDEVVWLQAHNYLTFPGNQHKHFSIEASDAAGLKQTRFSVSYGADTNVVNVNAADFYVAGSGGIRTIDSDFDGILKLTPVTTFDVYPQSGSTYGLRTTLANTDEVTLSAIGSSYLYLNDALMINTASGADYSSLLRFGGEGASNFQGGYIQYDAAGNAFIIGTHNTADELNASDVEVMLIPRAGTSVTFNVPLTPVSNDLAAIGSPSLGWSDLFLASGGVINWNNGDVSLTHSSNKLALSGGEFSFDSSLSGAYRGITALRTLDNTDYFIDCTANTFTVTLPTAVGITGRQYIIKNSGTGVITVDGNGSETIDGQTTWALPAQYDSITIMSDGANWKIIGKA